MMLDTDTNSSASVRYSENMDNIYYFVYESNI